MPVDQPPQFLAARRHTVSWPAIEFLYPDDKPGIGYCVDFPEGTCGDDQSMWKRKHDIAKAAKARGPLLRLDLRNVISGYEMYVVNEGEALAQGVNVDVVAWQAGAPGPEWVKSYAVRDLSPLADFTIANVFGRYREPIAE